MKKNKEEDTFNISKENTKEGSYIITHKNKRNMDNIKIGRYDNINDKKEFSSNILYKCVKKK